ncbi:MAG: Omega-amidase YafV [Bacteroidia bacterium]|nr:Omega-amidase YafV [Bacteroidia bacterium]
MEDLKITLVQTQLHWESVEKNISMFDELLNAVKEQTDLIVLPEMFSTGFTMNTAVAETMQGKSIIWLKEKAKEKNCVITGSLMIKENGKNYNRLIWMQPDGSFETYNKRHLFRMANEQNHFTAGDKKLITTLKGWKICPLICYDLRFPVWSRNKVKSKIKSEKSEVEHNSLEYDLLLYVANWPARRSLAWNMLIPARAVENQSYVVAVNRIGGDGHDVDYSGDSAVYNPLGEKLSSIKPNENTHETITLSRKFLQDYRDKFPAAMDADDFELK